MDEIIEQIDEVVSKLEDISKMDLDWEFQQEISRALVCLRFVKVMYP